MSADTIFISGRDSFGKLKPPSVVAIPKKRGRRRDHVNFSPPAFAAAAASGKE